MSCAMKVTEDLTCTTAMTEETAMKNSTKPRTQEIVCFSCICLRRAGAMTSNVREEPEVNTKEDRVDMDAERTRMTTMPIRISDSPESICGTMLS